MIRIGLIIIMILYIPFSDCFACTIFSITKQNTIYFCNNEDWSDYNTRLWVRPSNDNTYGAIFWGFSNYWAQGGMNEEGLSWDWTAGYKVDDWKPDPNKPTYDGNLTQKILEECATVDEALPYYTQYNEQSFSYARTLLTDKLGNSAIVGWKDGKLMIERGVGEYQVMGYGLSKAKALLDQNVPVTIDYLASILDSAHQEGRYPTQYSNINDVKNGIVYVFYRQNFEEFITIHVHDELGKGSRNYDLSSFFSHITVHSPTIVRKADSVSATFKWQGKPESMYKLYYSTDRKFDNYKAVKCIYSSSYAFDYAFFGLSIPVYFLLGGIKRKKKYFLILLIFIFLASTNCGVTQKRTEYEQYKLNLPKVETKEFSKTIDNLQPNTTYYWKIVAHPKGNDHFLSESFVYSFTME